MALIIAIWPIHNDQNPEKVSKSGLFTATGSRIIPLPHLFGPQTGFLPSYHLFVQNLAFPRLETDLGQAFGAPNRSKRARTPPRGGVPEAPGVPGVPGGSQGGPRGSQGSQEGSQEGSQGGPRGSQEGLRGVPGVPEAQNVRSRGTFGLAGQKWGSGPASGPSGPPGRHARPEGGPGSR